MPAWTAFKKTICTILANSVLLSSVAWPTQNAMAVAGEFTPPYRDHCSIVDCAFSVQVPTENWQEITSLSNAQGARGRVDGSSLYSGERWMSLGQEAAGILGLSSADVVLKAWQSQLESPPWVVARFVPDTGELRINVLKTIKTPDGFQRVLSADYTPQHGRYDVVRRNFLSEGEKRSPYTRGQDPFLRFAGAPTDPTFYNMTAGSAQVAVGRAMSHFKTPYALYIETAVRLAQTQRKHGNAIKRKITTTTEGFARPKFYLAAPLNMTAGRNNITPAAMAVICPRAAACTDANQLAFSGIVLEPLVGGNIADIEERIYSNVQTKSSWGVLAFVALTALAVWSGGALYAGTASWGVANGAIVATASQSAATLISAGFYGSTAIAASASLGYATLNSMLNGGPLTSPQQSWLGAMGMDAQEVTHGVLGSLDCNNPHCQGVNTAASNRHIKSGSPGTTSSGNNLQATLQVVAGMAPTAASHPNQAYNAEVYERKRRACIGAGHGSNQQTLYRCMAASLVVDGSTGEQ